MLVLRLQPKVVARQRQRGTDDAAEEIDGLAHPSAPTACVKLEDEAADFFLLYEHAQKARKSLLPNGERPREARQRNEQQYGQSPEAETDVAIVQKMLRALAAFHLEAVQQRLLLARPPNDKARQQV